MKIKVMPFLQKKGNRVAKGAIEFSQEDLVNEMVSKGIVHSLAKDIANSAIGALNGFQLVGFTICDDSEKGLFILFPSSIVKRGEETKPYFFLRPSDDTQLDKLQDAILDVYESMTAGSRGFNSPRIVPNSIERKDKSETKTSESGK